MVPIFLFWGFFYTKIGGLLKKQVKGMRGAYRLKGFRFKILILHPEIWLKALTNTKVLAPRF